MLPSPPAGALAKPVEPEGRAGSSPNALAAGEGSLQGCSEDTAETAAVRKRSRAVYQAVPGYFKT